jgi:hypothetical protein
MAGMGNVTHHRNLFQDLEFGGPYPVALDQNLVASEPLPYVIESFGGWSVAVHDLFNFRVSEDQEFFGTKSERRGESIDKRNRGPAATVLNVGNVAGFDAERGSKVALRHAGAVSSFLSLLTILGSF